MMEDEMTGWHHRLDGHEFEQTLGDGKGQGSLACCSSQGLGEPDITESLNSSTNQGPWLGGLTEGHQMNGWASLFLPRGSAALV